MFDNPISLPPLPAGIPLEVPVIQRLPIWQPPILIAPEHKEAF